MKEFKWTDKIVAEYGKFRMFFNSTFLNDEDGIKKFKKIHYPEPLFITEDGVEMFEGNICYAVDLRWNAKKAIENWVKITKDYYENIYCPGANIYFSTESAAKDYVINNKPFLSVNDVMSVCYNSEFSEGTELRYQLLELSKNNNNF